MIKIKSDWRFAFLLSVLVSLIYPPVAISHETQKATKPMAKKKYLHSLVDTFNHGDTQAITRYIADNFDPDRIEQYGLNMHVDVFLNQQNTYGKLTIIEPAEEKRKESNNEKALVKAQNNQLLYQLNINTSKTAPFKINYFYFNPPKNANIGQHAKQQTEQQAISPAEFSQTLSRFMALLERNQAFSGNVLVAKNNRVIFQRAVGQANKSFDIDNNLETKFSLGSMNKMFTAIAALQLIEQKKLTFDDKLVDFVDKSWLPEGKTELITVRHLLTHTSGFGNFFNDEFNQTSKINFRALSGYKSIIASTPLMFEPGADNRYSNIGMHMLGLMIEKASGQSYDQVIQQNIYAKADMTNSDNYALDGITPNLAVGYLKMSHSDTWVSNTYAREIKGGPAGGGFSTVMDLFNFSRALTSYQLLSKALTEQAWCEKTEYNSPPWYGYGFVVGGQPDDRIVGHSGAYLGVDAGLDIHLDKNIVVVILANQSDVLAPVRRKIGELIGLLE